jgi:hypothetical protein
MAVLDKHRVGDPEEQQVLMIACSLKGQIMHAQVRLDPVVTT